MVAPEGAAVRIEGEAGRGEDPLTPSFLLGAGVGREMSQPTDGAQALPEYARRGGPGVSKYA